jgi:dephospho-CoA kinase
VLLVGLTGGIGSGKSTVAALLAERGALVVDADELARAAIAPGTPGAARVAERFPGVVGADGAVDRTGLAEVVFADAVARRDLEAIVHPEVRRLLGERVAAAPVDAIVVFVAPLLVETGAAEGFDPLVVVTAPEDVRLERLATSRGMDPSDARARIAAQASEAARVAAADLVVDNGGPRAALAVQVDALWAELARRAGR